MKNFIKETLECELFEKMILKEGVNPSEELEYHIKNKISLHENDFRIGSKKYAELINEVRKLYKEEKISLCSEDEEIINTDAGKEVMFNNKKVYLDTPYVNLELNQVSENEYKGKKVKLNKPKRGGNKAYYVYVKNPKTGNIIKVEFGSGMRAKINDPEARKRYNKRHGCSKGKHNDKTKAGYWSCRLPRYAKSLGLSGGGTWW